MEEQKSNRFLVFLIVFFFLFIFIITFFWQKNLNQKSKEKINSSNTVSPIISKIKEKPKAELIFKKIDDFNYEIIASSNNHNITGFDLLIEATRPSDLDTIVFSSSLSSFSLYQFKKDNFLILTGIKKLSFNQPIVFEQTPIVNLKTTKIIKLNLKTGWGKYTTKLVDDQNSISTPKIILK